MKQQDVLLIHGTWGHGYEWDKFGAELTKRGYRVHSPSWRAHGHPREIDIWDAADEVAQLSLLDFVGDLVHLVHTMETPPIIVGHSAGGLLAQLVAARARHSGIALLAPAPGAGIFSFYPSALQLWGEFVPQWVFGRPMYPVKKKKWEKYICNTTPRELSDRLYSGLCAESGRAYREMVFWMFYRRRNQHSRVDYDKISGPVLVVAGAEDKCCVPRMVKATARRYRSHCDYVEVAGSDHMMITGPFMQNTLNALDEWAQAKGVHNSAGPAAQLGDI